MVILTNVTLTISVTVRNLILNLNLQCCGLCIKLCISLNTHRHSHMGSNQKQIDHGTNSLAFKTEKITNFPVFFACSLTTVEKNVRFLGSYDVPFFHQFHSSH